MAQKGKNAAKLAKFWNGRRGWIASSGLRSSHAPTIHCLPTSGETSNSNSISVLLFLGQKTIFPSSYTATILMARLKLPVAFGNESPEEFESNQARGGPPTIHHRYIMRNTSQFYGVKKKNENFWGELLAKEQFIDYHQHVHYHQWYCRGEKKKHGYSGIPLNGHPSTVDTHDIVNNSESPDCPSIHINT